MMRRTSCCRYTSGCIMALLFSQNYCFLFLFTTSCGSTLYDRQGGGVATSGARRDSLSAPQPTKPPGPPISHPLSKALFPVYGWLHADLTKAASRRHEVTQIPSTRLRARVHGSQAINLSATTIMVGHWPHSIPTKALVFPPAPSRPFPDSVTRSCCASSPTASKQYNQEANRTLKVTSPINAFAANASNLQIHRSRALLSPTKLGKGRSSQSCRFE